jgi:hypothetical protein
MVIEAPSDADNFLFFRAASAFTVSAVNCMTNTAATTTVITIQECDANGAACVSVATGTCNATNTSLTVTNGTIDAGDWVRVDVGTVSGTPGHVNVCATGS